MVEQMHFEVCFLNIGEAEHLGELWSADVVLLLCDGAYPEVGGGVTMLALRDWVRHGGILIELAASAFLLAHVDGRFHPSIRTFIDVFELVVESNVTDQFVDICENAPIALRATKLPMSLVDLNHGCERRCTLNYIESPTISFVNTSRGSCVFGEYRIEQGWLFRWGAAGYGPIAHLAFEFMLQEGYRRALPSRQRRGERSLIVGPTLTSDGEFDRMILWTKESLSSEKLSLSLEGLGIDVSPSGRGQLRTVVLPSPIDIAADVIVATPQLLPITHMVISGRPTYPAHLPNELIPVRPINIDQFWMEKRNGSRFSWELKPTMTIASRNSKVDITRASCELAERPPAMGILTRPTMLDCPAPAILFLPGYSCSAEDELPERFAEEGIIGFSLGFGETPNCGGDIHDSRLLSEHPDDPENFGYLRVILMALAGVEFLAGLPFVDSKRLAVVGASQGGGLALITAGLDSRIKAVASLVPYLCDIMRTQAVVDAEPSTELRRWLIENPTRADVTYRTLQYFDAVNFVEKIVVPTLFLYSPTDEVVHPDSVELAISQMGRSPDVHIAREGHLSPALLKHRRFVDQWIVQALLAG
jgi:cephalosporin-C deacetylase